ncbi:MAG TPA: hypothetical protein VGF26_12470 [Ramlibacter sp.]
MMSQLERAALPRDPVRPQSRDGRYVVRLVPRGGQDAPEAAASAEVFDAMSCLLLACRCVARHVSTEDTGDARPLIRFMTRQHPARVMARLGPVLASCNERLRDSPWELVATRTDVH